MNDRDREVLPSIKPDQDEVAAYQTNRRTEAPKQSNFNGVLVFAIVLMAIMMAVGGFALYEVQRKLEESNELLARGQQTDQELADDLAATGTGVDRTLQVLQGKLEVNESEIRKLWDVANKRNRGWIKANEEAVKELAERVGAVDEASGRLVTSVGRIEAAFARLDKDMADVRQALVSESEELSTQVALVRGQVQDAAVAVGGHQRLIAVIEKKLKNTEADIAAIDRYRLQVNQQLLELREMVQTSSATSSRPLAVKPR